MRLLLACTETTGTQGQPPAACCLVGHQRGVLGPCSIGCRRAAHACRQPSPISTPWPIGSRWELRQGDVAPTGKEPAAAGPARAGCWPELPSGNWAPTPLASRSWAPTWKIVAPSGRRSESGEFSSTQLQPSFNYYRRNVFKLVLARARRRRWKFAQRWPVTTPWWKRFCPDPGRGSRGGIRLPHRGNREPDRTRPTGSANQTRGSRLWPNAKQGSNSWRPGRSVERLEALHRLASPAELIPDPCLNKPGPRGASLTRHGAAAGLDWPRLSPAARQFIGSGESRPARAMAHPIGHQRLRGRV